MKTTLIAIPSLAILLITQSALAYSPSKDEEQYRHVIDGLVTSHNAQGLYDTLQYAGFNPFVE